MIKFWDFLLSVFTPFVIFTGKIYMPFSRKKIKGEDYYSWRDQISIGMVILTKTEGEFSNLINPVKIKHAGIYVGEIKHDGIYYVLEATSKGVKLTDLVTFLTTKDLAIGCTPNFIRQDGMFEKTLQEEALKYVGKPYDYLFQQDGKAFYCFELAAMCLKSVYSELQLSVREIVKSKRVYDGETFLDPRFFDIKFDSRNTNK